MKSRVDGEAAGLIPPPSLDEIRRRREEPCHRTSRDIPREIHELMAAIRPGSIRRAPGFSGYQLVDGAVVVVRRQMRRARL